MLSYFDSSSKYLSHREFPWAGETPTTLALASTGDFQVKATYFLKSGGLMQE